MTKLSKAKIKAKARMARNLRNLFGTYPFDYTPLQHKAQIISARISFENED